MEKGSFTFRGILSNFPAEAGGGGGGRGGGDVCRDKRDKKISRKREREREK